MAFESPIPIENEKQRALIGVSTFCIFIATSMVALRLLGKAKSSKQYNASDACILAALVCIQHDEGQETRKAARITN